MKAFALAAALAAVTIGAAPSALASGIAFTPTYGAFAEGGIGNNGDGAPNVQGVQCGGVCYYDGTNYSSGVGAYSSASGSVGSPGSWGYSSATANLATGLISVTASANGNPPDQDNPPPFGSPAGATAGFFTEIMFDGPGTSGIVSVTMSGTASESGNTSLTYSINLNTCCFFGGGAPITVTDGSWSETQDFTVDYGVDYYLSVFLAASSSGSFLPGAASVTDPFSLGLPQGVTYTAADTTFLQGSSAVPEPASLVLLGTGLLAFGGLSLRRKSA